MIGFPWSLYSHPIFLWSGVKLTLNTKSLLVLIKERSKTQEKNMSCERALILTNGKHFPKTMSQWEFEYDLFTNLPRIIVACNFSPSSFNLKRGILSYQTKNFLVSWTSRELTPCKISHICRCDLDRCNIIKQV